MTFEKIDFAHGFRICTLFSLAVVSLIVVGYQSLLPILIDNGVFSSYCNGRDECNAQILILSFMFESAISMLNISGLFWGSLCLKYSRQRLMACGGVFCMISCILFAFGTDWIKFFSFILLSFGGCGFLFPAFVIPLQYSVKLQGFIFGVLVGGENFSAIIFYLFKLIHDNSDISLPMLFVFLAIVFFIALFLGPMFLFSKKLFSVSFDDESQSDSYNDACTSQETISFEKSDHLHSDYDVDAEENVEDDINDGVATVAPSLLTMLSAIFQRLSHDMLFWMIVVWSCLYVNTKYFYIGTLNQQLKWITDNDASLITRAVTVFDILLPCACVFAPFSGTITNKVGLPFSVCILGIISLVAAIASVIQMYYLQYFTMILIIFNRFLYFVIAPLIVGNVYGTKEQTTIYGIIICVAAIYNYVSYLWDYICIGILNYDFTIINLALGISCLVSSLCTAYLLSNRQIKVSI